ncbi:hypothetical protein E2542_SST09029 [Spatholobus suberectus]|nr:hypothetical protein E2542_SST09029 [Spatholobus suberectus]
MGLGSSFYLEESWESLERIWDASTSAWFQRRSSMLTSSQLYLGGQELNVIFGHLYAMHKDKIADLFPSPSAAAAALDAVNSVFSSESKLVFR